jgi:preprotein translocase subunit SecA
LNEEARTRGGLHVIDRQLGGRCGRQGDPGRISSHVALDDDLIQRHAPPVMRAGAGLWFGPAKSRWLLRTARLAQRRAERLHARMRADLLRSEEWIGDAIGFVGNRSDAPAPARHLLICPSSWLPSPAHHPFHSSDID